MRSPSNRFGPEAVVVRDILVWARYDPRVRLWRNDVRPGGVGLGRGVSGLGPGSPDLVGHVIITLPSGRRIARALYVEVKRPGGGILSPAQIAWLDQARRDGAIVVVARDVADVIEAVDQAIMASSR